MKKEIGSYFCFSEFDCNNLSQDVGCNILEDTTYFTTCRSAVEMVLCHLNLENKVALIPGFTCHAVLEPFIKNMYNVIPFKITKQMATDKESFIKAIERFNPGVILVHDYFGFHTNDILKDTQIQDIIFSKKINVIIDKTQSMFSNNSDYHSSYIYVGSIRKWMGIPDGAFLKGLKIKIDLSEDTALTNAKKKAMNYKFNYIYNNDGNKKDLLTLYKEAEYILENEKKPFAMSSLSKTLLNNYNIDNLKTKRRSNYAFLLDGLLKYKFLNIPFKELGDDVVPFYFPVFVKKNRKQFQSFLAKNYIYATVIWGCPQYILDRIDKVCREIYDEILCIPCDQRYDIDDMAYIINVIHEYEKDNYR